MDQLDDAEAVLNQLKALWKDKKDKDLDTLNKTHKKIAEKLKAVKEFMAGKKQEKQGYGVPPAITPLSTIRKASMLITSKNMMPSAQEEAAIDMANKAAAQVAAKANEFFTNDWAPFRKLVESHPVKTFKDVETIK
jgi:hypothetical protein